MRLEMSNNSMVRPIMLLQLYDWDDSGGRGLCSPNGRGERIKTKRDVKRARRILGGEGIERKWVEGVRYQVRILHISVNFEFSSPVKMTSILEFS